MPTISVIIPTYNRAAFLAECIRSVLDQRRPVLEILVVDDGSRDNTAEVVAGIKGPIRYIRQENSGKAAALNRAMAEVRGEYVWICDDDDLALPDATERLAGALDGTPHGLAYGRYLTFRDADGPAAAQPPYYWPYGDEQDALRASLEDAFIFQFACLVRKSCYDAVGPFRADLVRSQDYEMAIRLLRRFSAAFVDAPIFLQREHSQPRGSSSDRFVAAEQSAKWVHYDRLIFEGLYQDMALEEFLPRPMQHLTGDARRRAALLQRGCALSRRHMWDKALADFAAAVTLGGTAAASQQELEIVRRLPLGRHGCKDLAASPGLAARLIGSFGNSAFGRSLLNQIRKSLAAHSSSLLLQRKLRPALGYGKVLVAVTTGLAMRKGGLTATGAAGSH